MLVGMKQRNQIV